MINMPSQSYGVDYDIIGQHIHARQKMVSYVTIPVQPMNTDLVMLNIKLIVTTRPLIFLAAG